jgi:protein O-GlcNAc transferase
MAGSACCTPISALRVERRTVIAIHDFWNRPAYHAALPFLDEIDRCETLGVFRVKPDMDHDAAKALLALAAYWPR